MYQSDANLVVPADDTPLWRYLDFARFMALLDSASLWFARADTFSDQYELAVPAADMAAARSGAAAIFADGRTRDGVVRYLAAMADQLAEELAGLPDSEIAGLLLRFAGRARYISCWQEDEDESAGMWDSFVQGDNGVAVVTTVGAFPRCPRRRERTTGRVSRPCRLPGLPGRELGAVSPIRPGVPQAPTLQAGAGSPCRHGLAQLP